MGRNQDALAEFDAVLTAEREQLGDTTRTPSTPVIGVDLEKSAATRRPSPSSTPSSPRSRSSSATRPTSPTTHHHEQAPLRELGANQDALAEFDAVLTAEREQLGDTHPDTLTTRHERARTLRELGLA